MFNKSLIAGTLAMLLAVIAFYTLPEARLIHTSLLIISAVVFFIKATDKDFSKFVNSFKRHKKIAIVCFYDIIFWALFFSIGWLGYSILNIFAAKHGLLGVAPKVIATRLAAEGKTALLTQVLIISLINLVLVLLGTLFIYTLSRWLMWRLILKKDFRFSKLLGGTALWWSIWGGLFLLFVIGMQEVFKGFSLILITLLYFHLTWIFQTTIAETKKVFDSLRKSLARGFTIIPWVKYAYSLLLYNFLVLLTVLFNKNLSAESALVTSLISIIIMFGWFRNYIVS